ncbi:hypothetical protein NBRC10512_007688 [Rhodotorula toruloides]|uniref:Protein HIR n=1 Tax=Rhodotorula toruloides (strain NP11) TaxID=1130832 RepID=M7WJR6_RHOT1|nr:protein HIRA/HIR1 [Rhodotorula toruloides NP11]EMS20722.1 protein HIRA/HIR1 [Rhodotorula toruloides NP11]
MHIIKPSWVSHPDETRPTKPDLTIFSLDVHPDNSRLATGGLDSIVRIWSTVPILNEQAEKDDERCPKLLSTLTAHTGVIMSVRWNNAGGYLASGSDDRVVMIWAHDGGKGGKVWGTETTNVENWKATRRLVGHNSDVAGVAWSPDDAYVASVGLDNIVLVWSGQNFELVRKLDAHAGFVKGLVFDPVGQFLATQADDNSLKVWRTDDWALQADITDPFVDAPKATVVRPTWSPDGAHIVTPNSMNGPVFCAAVIQRTTWLSPASLIGHPDIVQAASYNPLIFLRDPSKPPDMSNVCSLLALCAQGTVSLWFTDTSQPFVVVNDLFDREALDLSWSRDGKQLWASSSDGQVAVLTFDYGEFAPVAPEGTKAALHATYGYTPSRARLVAAPAVVANGIGAAGGAATPGGPAGGTLAQPNTLVARKGPGAKRPRTVQLSTQPLPAQQQPVASTSAAAFASAPTLPGSAASAFQQAAAQQPVPQQMFGAPPPPAAASTSRKRKASNVPVEGGPTAAPPPGAYPHPYPYLAEAPPPQIPGYGSAPRLSSAPYRLAGHTLRGDPAPPDEELRELVPAYALYDREVTFRVTNRRRAEGGRKRLAVPQVVTFGKVALEDSDAKDTLEYRNFAQGDRKGEAEITVVTSKKPLWTDYVPKYVVNATGSPVFSAVSLEDGSMVAWSPTGRRLIPTLVLDAPCSFLTAEGSYLMAITALGTLTVWNLSPSIPKPRSIYPPLNISSLLASSATRIHPDPAITTSALLPNGSPLLALDSGATFSYDADLAAWTRVSEAWWSKADTWEGRRGRHSAPGGAAGRGIVKKIEAAVNEIVVDDQQVEQDETTDEEDADEGKKADGDVEMNGGSADKGKGKAVEGEDESDDDEPRPPKRTVPQGSPTEPQGGAGDFRIAVTLAHLETRIKAAQALDSPAEYRNFLLAYAKRLADEGLRSKAEELIKELLGPIYHNPNRKEEEWSPTVLGLQKRDLLREVLRELAKQRTTTPLANEYQDLLKKVQTA